MQNSLPFKTAKLLPWNHYARKNLGYLYAIMQGADLLYETDDDNLPYPSWPEFYPVDLDAETYLHSEQKFINVYSHFCKANVWPRGFPLTCIRHAGKLEKTVVSNVSAPIQQGLADLEPDVDAIYRLTIGDQIKFSENSPLFLGSGTYCPFNSQNTLWYPEAFQYLFLPAFVPSRVTDIWRGYIAQHFLQQNEQGILFCNPSVYQERNYHNLLHDFVEEIELYIKTESLIECLEAYSSNHGNFTDVISHLSSKKFVGEEDARLFEAWIDDLNYLGVNLA